MKIIALALIPLNLLIATAAAAGDYVLHSPAIGVAAALAGEQQLYNDLGIACVMFLLMAGAAVVALAGFIMWPAPSSLRSGAAQAGTAAPRSA